MFNDEAGYGVKGDTFRVLDTLTEIGDATWFRIGDKDFATHLIRTDMLRRGHTLTETSLAIGARFGLKTRVIPMTDDSVRTRFNTDAGELSFQEYFVRERLKPQLQGIAFAGIDSAHRTPDVSTALREADLVIIGPSNPLISIAPILTLVRNELRRERTMAVTPIIGGVALKGPTVEMMRAVGRMPDSVEVARMYRDVAGTFVIDERDGDRASAIEELGYRTVVCDTVMRDGGGKLAAALLSHV